MANPLRYRIKDISGKCFDAFIHTADSVLEDEMFQKMISRLNSVRPLNPTSAHYAATLLNVAGLKEGIDYKVEELRTPEYGYADSDSTGHRG